MRTRSLLFMLLAVVLGAVPAAAQTNVAPTQVLVEVWPSGVSEIPTQPESARAAFRLQDIAPNQLCNLPKISLPANSPREVDPDTLFFDDPFTSGRSCAVPLPSSIPPGTNYAASARFLAPTCQPQGTPVSPCPPSERRVAVPRFDITPPVVITNPPVAPAGVGVR